MASSSTKDEVHTADLSNWRDSPNNQWSFNNINKVLRVDTIPRSSNPATPSPQRLNSFSSFQLNLPSGTTLGLEGFLTASQSDALLVLHDSEVVLERYARQATPHAPHILMSMSKSVCGLLVGILQAQGRLSVDDAVATYVPEVRGTAYEHVTVRQCIDMRAGLAYADGTPAYRVAAGWNPPSGAPGEATDLHSFIREFRPTGPQDDRFEYVSVNTDLIGWVLERASGGQRSLAGLVHELLWEPMGAESEAWMATDQAGHARAAGGLCATLRDVARLGQVLVDGGKAQGREVVPARWIEDIVHGGDKDAFARGSWASGGFKGLAYRSFCLAREEEDVIIGLGIFGQMLFVDRKNKIVMVKFGSQETGIDSKMTGLGVLGWQEVRRVLLEGDAK